MTSGKKLSQCIKHEKNSQVTLISKQCIDIRMKTPSSFITKYWLH